MKNTRFTHAVMIVMLLLATSAQASPHVIHNSTETNTTMTSHSTTVTHTTINQTSTSTSIGIETPFIPEVVTPDVSFPDFTSDIPWPDQSNHRTDRWLLERLKRIDGNASPWKEDKQAVLFRWKGKTIVASRSFSELTLKSWFTRTDLSSREALDRSNRWNRKTFGGRSWVTNEFKGPRFWLQWSVPLDDFSDDSWNDEKLRDALKNYVSLIDDFVCTIDTR